MPGTRTRALGRPRRILRLLRTARAHQEFHVILKTFSAIVPTFLRYLVVGFMAYYSYSIIGMETFAGRTYRGNPALFGTAYNNSVYWNNNFDTLVRRLCGQAGRLCVCSVCVSHCCACACACVCVFSVVQPRSMVTLFELQVVNNWPIIMEGFMAATTGWAAIYFYLWYFIIVVLVSNVSGARRHPRILVVASLSYPVFDRSSRRSCWMTLPSCGRK